MTEAQRNQPAVREFERAFATELDTEELRQASRAYAARLPCEDIFDPEKPSPAPTKFEFYPVERVKIIPFVNLDTLAPTPPPAFSVPAGSSSSVSPPEGLTSAELLRLCGTKGTRPFETSVRQVSTHARIGMYHEIKRAGVPFCVKLPPLRDTVSLPVSQWYGPVNGTSNSLSYWKRRRSLCEIIDLVGLEETERLRL
jgi:hypothetical protein